MKSSWNNYYLVFLSSSQHQMFTCTVDLLCAWLRIKLSTTFFGSYPSLPQPTVGKPIDLTSSFAAICRQVDIIVSSICNEKEGIYNKYNFRECMFLWFQVIQWNSTDLNETDRPHNVRHILGHHGKSITPGRGLDFIGSTYKTVQLKYWPSNCQYLMVQAVQRRTRRLCSRREPPRDRGTCTESLT